MKRLQNKVAESRWALTVTVAYGLLVWLAAGLLTEGWWLQLACFATSCYLMVLLNNIHALIRVYSRMVSCAFIALTCTASFIFPSLHGAVFEVCVIASIFTLFATYQDRGGAAWTFYAFALWGMASMTFIHVLWLVPLLWILMFSNLMALSWRTWGASVIGLIAPYWFWSSWLLYEGHLGLLLSHFVKLWSMPALPDYTALPLSHLLCFTLTAGLLVTGIIHFLRQRSRDKIRTRMLFYSLMWLGLAATVYTILFPAHFDFSFRLMVVFTAPLVGHFLTLTNTKVTNIAFIAISVLTLALTFLNLEL